MATIVTRAGKGSPLTNTEVDANFTNLNTELGQKLVASDATSANTASKLVQRDASGNFSAGTITANVTGTVSHPFPAGTRMPFAQSAAPTGWTQDTGDGANNRMLRVVNTAGNGTGGTHSPILNNLVPSHTHGFSTGTVSSDHSHYVSGTTSGVGNHTHGVPAPNSSSGTQHLQAEPSAWKYSVQSDGAGAHSHTWGAQTGGISANHTHSGSTDNGSSQTNWQPRYIDMIICSKNV
jgi:hypothetical protein